MLFIYRILKWCSEFRALMHKLLLYLSDAKAGEDVIVRDFD